MEAHYDYATQQLCHRSTEACNLSHAYAQYIQACSAVKNKMEGGQRAENESTCLMLLPDDITVGNVKP
eukprot:scaffold58342_cov28-Tisochrysis_lutea.AAC.1